MHTHLAALLLALCIQLALGSVSGVIQGLHGPDPGGHQLTCSHGGSIAEVAHHRAATHQACLMHHAQLHGIMLEVRHVLKQYCK